MALDDDAMQTRCPNCLGEQYMLNVLTFSAGETACAHCGEWTRPMSYRQWYDALAAARKRLNQP